MPTPNPSPNNDSEPDFMYWSDALKKIASVYGSRVVAETSKSVLGFPASWIDRSSELQRLVQALPPVGASPPDLERKDS